jgi:hypothetical protein
MVTLGIYVALFYAYYELVGRLLEKEMELLDDVVVEVEAEKEPDETLEDDGYAHPDSLFIPLTWAKKLPRTYYRGSDPEWQEFIKIAKDQERRKKIIHELVQIVYSQSVKNRVCQDQLGENMKPGKFWLDLSFPNTPPQEYERSGIEFADTYIAWSRSKISPETQFRINRALWPKATFDAFYASGKVLAGINYRRIKQALGLEEKDPFSIEERYQQAIKLIEQRQVAKDMKKKFGQAHPEHNAKVDAVSTAVDSSQKGPPRSTGTDGEKLPWIFQPIYTVGIPKDIPLVMHVFQSALKKTWNPRTMEPPRGTFIVEGLVEVRGSKGRITFDVKSYYDPQEEKFKAATITRKSFSRWTQAPLGGQ